MYKLSSGDLEDYRMLKNIHLMIYEVYEALYKLELNGKKNSVEYDNLVKRLKDLKELEKSNGNRLLGSMALIDAFKDKIVKDEHDDFYENYPLVFNPLANKDELLKFRFINLLSLKYQDFLTNAPKESIKLLETGETIPQELLDTLRYIDLFVKNVLLDQIRIAVTLFIEDSHQQTNINIWVKYALSYAISSIEDEFIAINFNKPESVMMYHKVVNGFFPQETPIKLTASNLNSSNLLANLSKIESLRNVYYYDELSVASINFLACTIRAALVMLDDEEAKILIDRINNAINNLKSISYTELTIKTLQNIIDSRASDKEKLQIVTFGR